MAVYGTFKTIQIEDMSLWNLGCTKINFSDAFILMLCGK
jgi:hypothetical protein